MHFPVIPIQDLTPASTACGSLDSSLCRPQPLLTLHVETLNHLEILWPLIHISQSFIKPALWLLRVWELDHNEGWASKNWCFLIVLEKPLESPSDGKEIKPVHPKGNWPWIFIGRTDGKAEVPVLWPPDAKTQLSGKDLDSGKDWGQEEKGIREDGTVGWHHQLYMILNKLQKTVKNREAWRATVYGVAKSWTQLSDWKATTITTCVITGSVKFPGHRPWLCDSRLCPWHLGHFPILHGPS